ncbi:MAG: hypothetical protein AUI47_06760 [Acidobacteria bacterium 13_1_40CM_2_68_5]|nr:MAG: hypothetical protein AUI47_06760 [Acidobacteria bacterium 13_1_40CM_2_68_5]
MRTDVGANGIGGRGCHIAAALCLALLGAPALIACGGGGGGHHGVVTRITCGGVTVPGQDQVEFACPANSVSPIAVRVVIGPTSSMDVYGIKFDVVFDPAVLNFDSPAMEGSFLNKDGSPTVLEAATQPGDPGRLVVAVTRQGAVGGVGTSGAQTTVVTLPFAAVAAGTTSLGFENGTVVDSGLAPIAAIQFGSPVSVTFQ